MWRLRRYRAFLLLAIIATIAFYHFTLSNEWDNVVPVVDELRKESDITHETLRQEYSADEEPSIIHEHIPQAFPPIQQKQESTTSISSIIAKETLIVPAVAPTKTSESPEIIPEIAIPDPKSPETLLEQLKELEELSVNPQEEIPATPSPTTIHWQEQPEKYPVPIESIIELPTGKPVAIRKIQYEFLPESPEAKAAREKKRDIIKDEAKLAWDGYKNHAWMHDEVKPVSGKFKDPFCGWAATLVDSLDTLWIMGMIPEFEEAVKAVDLIDFTTSEKSDIPMFETTIRYLGGLLAAYDISGAKHRNLLDKAVELAEILYAAFDTPNRMPILYYSWKPAFASQSHRAGYKVGTAELGSMAMEFTRLAQLTKEPRYYDAVARVTNALEEYQNRGEGIPGVFPSSFDASGCNMTLPSLPDDDVAPVEEAHGYEPPLSSLPKETKISDVESSGGPDIRIIPHNNDGPGKARIQGWDEHHNQDRKDNKTTEVLRPAKEMRVKRMRRQLNDPSLETQSTLPHKSGADLLSAEVGPYEGPVLDLPTKVAPYRGFECVPQGLVANGEKYSMGGGQDSAYEYFPKQYVLLGGLEDKYKTMYMKVIEAVRDNMLFRPMLPNDRNVLFSGAVTQTYTKMIFEAESTHLTCFIGGMVGMGAKLFDIEGDLEIAKRLTDGCVWAYESMPSGIMAEGSQLLPCSSIYPSVDPSVDNCPWNETLYWEFLDPFGATKREQNRAAYFEKKQLRLKLEAEQKAKDLKAKADAEELALKEKADAEELAWKTQADAEAARVAQAAHIATEAKDASAQEEADRLSLSASTASDMDDSSADEAAFLQQNAENYTPPSKNAPTPNTPKNPPLENMLDPIHKRELDSLEKAELPITHDLSPEASVRSNPTQQPDGETDSSSGIQKSKLPVVEDGFQKKLEQTEQELEAEAQNPHGSTYTADIDSTLPKLNDIPTVTGQELLDEDDDPMAPPTHEQYVQGRIKSERLPTGYTAVKSREYILRPEAIESVFYMYRITGDPIWQEKGWTMWKSIIKSVKTNYGHTAISDVTVETNATTLVTIQNDSMESFWLAETLKYFYLLFSEPELLSLDEWVLNTEAHPFKRPV